MANTKSAPSVVQKAVSTPKTVVPTSSEQGQPRIVTSSRMIEDSKKKELSMQCRLATFDSMYADDAVFKGVDLTNLFVVKSMVRGKYVSSGTPASTTAADFLNENLHSMSYGTWLDACLDMTTALKYGWSDLNIVLEKKKHGPYKGNYMLRKLSPRDQKSVYGWLWNDNLTEWKGLIQQPRLVQRKSFGRSFVDKLNPQAINLLQEQNYSVIGSQNLLHTSYNTSISNPQGDSPLMHCFDSWYEKKLIEGYELAGVSKDMRGLPLLRVPSQLIEQANDPEGRFPDSKKEYEALQKDMVDLHMGESSYIVLTSDMEPGTSNYLYDFNLMGVEGGSKNYMTSEIIDQKRKSIYNCFGAGVLLLGQSGSGSYALSSSQTSLHGHHVERDTLQYSDVMDSQLAPRLLAVNNIYLSYKDMPKWQPGDPDELSLDELGKVVQRMRSVGMMTQNMLEDLAARAGLPIEGIDDLSFEDPLVESGAGEGMATSGDGTAKKKAGGDKSTSNKENGGVTKGLDTQRTIVTQKGTDRLIDANTDECINADDLDRQGHYKT